jgi:hypothetical protein
LNTATTLTANAYDQNMEHVRSAGEKAPLPFTKIQTDPLPTIEHVHMGRTVETASREIVELIE